MREQSELDDEFYKMNINQDGMIVLQITGCYSEKDQLLIDLHKIYDDYYTQIINVYTNDPRFVDNKVCDKVFYETSKKLMKEKKIEALDKLYEEYFPNTEWKTGYYDALSNYWDAYFKISQWVVERFKEQ